MTIRDDVLQFLGLLGGAPKSRRAWRVLQCHCRGCGDLAVEVFRTPMDAAPLVAVYAGLKPAESGGRILGGLHDKGVRATEPTVAVLVSDLQDGFEVACKCGKRLIPARVLLAAVRTGQRELVLDTPT